MFTNDRGKKPNAVNSDRFARNVWVTAAPDQISSDLGGEVVILAVSNGNYYGLEGVAARVWELITKGSTVGEIEDTVLEEYDVKREQCERDLNALLHGLQDRGLVRISVDPMA